MKLLVINCGSSSIKFKLIQMPEEKVLCTGLADRIGSDSALLNYTVQGVSHKKDLQGNSSHEQGLRAISETLLDPQLGLLHNQQDVAAIGHRVVHGGTTFSDTTLITGPVKEKIKQLSSLAPLHNPVNLQGIELAENLFPEAKQVAVFDTAFHQSIPERAKKYAIPESFYERKLQVYGFHGTSHKYVASRAAEFLGRKDSRIITVHLGNGCSITAVKNGKSVDHSMGFAPANGLIMGTRSGDIDHSLIFYMVDNLGYELEEVKTLLLKESGMLGLTGYSDLREIEAEAEKGNKACIMALEMNAYRIKKYLGAYMAAMNGLDALVFTAGIGENSATIRKMVCSDMEELGIELAAVKNASVKRGMVTDISTSTSRIRILVVPTDEEIEIARQTYALASN